MLVSEESVETIWSLNFGSFLTFLVNCQTCLLLSLHTFGDLSTHGVNCYSCSNNCYIYISIVQNSNVPYVCMTLHSYNLCENVINWNCYPVLFETHSNQLCRWADWIFFIISFYKMRTLKSWIVKKLPRVKWQFSKRAETGTQVFFDSQSSIVYVLPHSPSKPNLQFLSYNSPLVILNSYPFILSHLPGAVSSSFSLCLLISICITSVW